jgi:hypothetical protein
MTDESEKKNASKYIGELIMIKLKAMECKIAELENTFNCHFRADADYDLKYQKQIAELKELHTHQVENDLIIHEEIYGMITESNACDEYGNPIRLFISGSVEPIGVKEFCDFIESLNEKPAEPKDCGEQYNELKKEVKRLGNLSSTQHQTNINLTNKLLELEKKVAYILNLSDDEFGIRF